jgi:hypothetical protein
MIAVARIGEPTYEADKHAASTRSLVRLARLVAGAPSDFATGDALEARHGPVGPARVAPAAVRESGAFARDVSGTPEVAFAGFLDGVQESRAAAWLSSGVPVVLAAIGAVILERVEQRLVCWPEGARVRRVLLAPRSLVDAGTWESLAAGGWLEDSGADAASRHPEALLTRAVHATEELRAADERALAEAWVAGRTDPLCIDGGVSSLGTAARSSNAIGVVKTHRTLYVDDAELPVLYSLAAGARSHVLALVETQHRPTVLTWYLRLREPSAVDPLHGVVRIEIADQGSRVTERADEVSRWLLAERTPLSLPDARWDVMPYGIARCEAYLKRGLGLAGARGGTS